MLISVQNLGTTSWKTSSISHAKDEYHKKLRITLKMNDATCKAHTKDHYKMIHTAESNCILKGSVYQIIHTEGEKFLWHVNCTYTIFSVAVFSVFCPPKIKLWWEIMHKRVKHKHHNSSIHPSIHPRRKKERSTLMIEK